MSIKLSIKDRYDLMKYVHKLPCTLRLRMAIDTFFQQIELTEEENTKYGININPVTYEISSNDDSYVKEYESFPEEVVNSLKEYVNAYDGKEEYKNNKLLQDALVIFKKVI